MINSPKDVKDWWKFVRSIWNHGLLGKAVILGVGSFATIWGLYFPLQLKKANDTIADRDREIVGLRFEKQNLITTNQAMQQMVDPIRRVYPDLPLAAAVANVIRDVDQIRTAAERPVFKPFSEDVRTNFIAQLRHFGNAYPDLSIQMGIDTTSDSRQLLANELRRCADDAGTQIHFLDGVIIGSTARTMLSFDKTMDPEAFKAFASCLGTIVKPPIPAAPWTVRTNRNGKIVSQHKTFELWFGNGIGFETNGLIFPK